MTNPGQLETLDTLMSGHEGLTHTGAGRHIAGKPQDKASTLLNRQNLSVGGTLATYQVRRSLFSRVNQLLGASRGRKVGMVAMATAAAIAVGPGSEASSLADSMPMVGTHIADCHTPVASAEIDATANIGFTAKNRKGQVVRVLPAASKSHDVPKAHTHMRLDIVACSTNLATEPVSASGGRYVIDLGQIQLKPQIEAINTLDRVVFDTSKSLTRTEQKALNTATDLRHATNIIYGMQKDALDDPGCTSSVTDAAVSELNNRLQTQVADQGGYLTSIAMVGQPNALGALLTKVGPTPHIEITGMHRECAES